MISIRLLIILLSFTAALTLQKNYVKPFYDITGRIHRQSTQHQSSKSGLLDIIDGRVDDTLVCPESLGDLKRTSRYYGFLEQTVFTNEQFDTKYTVYPNAFIDLTIKTEVDRPLFVQSPRGEFGESISQIYSYNLCLLVQ